MGGQKFQYDESGGTFFYFLLSFLALLLIPSTYYWWPRKQVEDPTKDEKDCHCPGCKRKKTILKSNEPWKGTKEVLTISYSPQKRGNREATGVSVVWEDDLDGDVMISGGQEDWNESASSDESFYSEFVQPDQQTEFPGLCGWLDLKHKMER
uniref:Uncharacterized protein n=1 Tax=Rhodnius prolixus TaxID=13249 RepID=T1HMV2_RHOPR